MQKVAFMTSTFPISRQLVVSLANPRISLCLLTLLLFFTSFYFIIRQHNPPNALTIEAPTTEFSSARAIQHLRVIAQAPHPIGSPAHDLVRDYIVRVLYSLQLNPQIQTVDTASPDRTTKQIQNIMVRLKGREPEEKAVMLVAHYDSVPRSYGAGDDGAGVVALLETLRALKSDRPLKKDMIALFTDGEEYGQLGAKAFLSQRQWSNAIEVVLNFEARGSRGPVFMFETSSNNGTLIKEFASTAPFPFANSLAPIIYDYLPNHTDLDVFRNAGYSGLNFAFIDAEYNYHTSNDNLTTIDERSIQHHGLYALSLARHFGNLKLEGLKAEDVVYFDVLGKVVIYYSKTMARILTGFNVILFAGVLIYGSAKKRLSFSEMAIGGMAFILSIACATVIIMIVIQMLSPRYGDHGLIKNNLLYFVFFSALAISVVSSVYLYFTKQASLNNLDCGTLLAYLVILLAVTICLPGSSYILAWPLLFAIFRLGFNIFYEEQNSGDFISFICHQVCTLPIIALVLWTILGVFQGIGLNFPLALMISVTFFIGFLLPYLKFLASPSKWLSPIVSALIGAIALVLAMNPEVIACILFTMSPKIISL